MTINGKPFSQLGNLKLKKGILLLGETHTTSPIDDSSYGLYVNSAGELIFKSTTSTTTLGAAGAGAGASSWDQIYAADQTLAIPGATLTFDGTHASNDVITISDSAAGSGDLLQFANTGTGKDVNGTGGTWSVTKAGVGVLAALTVSGTAGSTILTVTAGDAVMSDGSLAITDADNAATFTVTNNSATSASMVVIAGNGAFTGNTTSSFMTLTASGLTTGTVLYIPVVALTTGKAINVIGTTALTTGILVNVESGTTGTSLTGAGRLFRSAHTGTATNSGILNEFVSAATDETVILQVTASAALALGAAIKLSTAAVTTGTLISALGAALTSGSVLAATDLAALTTGVGIALTHATSVITNGSLIRLTSSGVNTGANSQGVMLDIVSTGQLAGFLVGIATIMTTGNAISVVSTGVMTTTGSLLTLTANSATTAAGLLRINANALTSGIGAVIASSATAITGAGRLLYVNHTGATSTSGILSEFASAANDETVIFKITASDVLALGTALSVSAASMTTGTGILVTATALTTGNGISITNNTSLTTGIMLNIASAATAITGAGRLVYVNHTGATGTTATLVEFASAANDETVIFKVTGSAALAAGAAAKISVASMTTGTALQINDANALTSGSIASLVSNSADTSARNLVFVHNDNAAAVSAVPIAMRNDAVTGTGSKFVRLWSGSDGSKTVTCWLSIDATTPNGALTGTAGDICLNGPSSVPFYCTGTTNWATLA
jgi:hypothetical protein